MRIGMPKYYKDQEVYLYTGESCVLVTILSSKLRLNEWVYETDCSKYDNGLILENVPERFLGKKVNKGKGNESLIRRFLNYVKQRN